MKEKTIRRDDKYSKGVTSGILILYNDDVNTFDHVIKALVEVCGHDAVQAEQCALIVHFKGKCDVKKGPEVMLRSMCRILNEKGLNSEVVSVD
jgi:ATP-dependent Clp protease adaptor protein ClpS